MIMKFRTKYDRNRVVSCAGGKSLTDQQYKEECSIEGIIKRYGVLPPPTVTPISVDTSNIGDFATAMQRVLDARSQFSELPAEIRRRFGDSPEALISFLADANNREEAIRLGLVECPVEDKDEYLETLKQIREAVTSKEEKRA